MPVFGKEVEEDLPARMRLDDRVVERYAQAGPARQREVAVDHLRIARRGRFDELLREIVEMLLDFEVRGARGQVQVGRGGDRPTNVVRGDQHVVRVRPGGQLLRFENAAKVGDVRLNDVRRLELE